MHFGCKRWWLLWWQPCFDRRTSNSFHQHGKVDPYGSTVIRPHIPTTTTSSSIHQANNLRCCCCCASIGETTWAPAVYWFWPGKTQKIVNTHTKEETFFGGSKLCPKNIETKSKISWFSPPGLLDCLDDEKGTQAPWMHRTSFSFFFIFFQAKSTHDYHDQFGRINSCWIESMTAHLQTVKYSIDCVPNSMKTWRHDIVLEVIQVFTDSTVIYWCLFEEEICSVARIIISRVRLCSSLIHHRHHHRHHHRSLWIGCESKHEHHHHHTEQAIKHPQGSQGEACVCTCVSISEHL